MTVTEPVWQSLPEIMHSDNLAKVDLWGDLSVAFAAEGQIVHALHAAWACDVSAVQAVVWERIAMASPRPEQEFAAAGSKITKALSLYAQDPAGAYTAADVVENARNGMFLAFDDVVERLVRSQFRPLTHLERVPVPTVEQIHAAAQERLQGNPVGTAIAVARGKSKQAAEVAREAFYTADNAEAIRSMYRSDLYAFDAYIMDASAVVGDFHMGLAGLRWRAAADGITALRGLPAQPKQAITRVRSVLTRILGPVEGEKFAAELYLLEP